MLEETEGTFKNAQSRDKSNNGKKTQNEDKQKREKNTIQKTIVMSNRQIPGVNPFARGKQLLLLIRHATFY